MKTITTKAWSGEKESGSDIAILILNETTCVKPIPHIGIKLKPSLAGVFLSFGRSSASGAFSGTLLGGQYSYVEDEECEESFKLRQPPSFKTMCGRSTDAGGVCAGSKHHLIFSVLVLTDYAKMMYCALHICVISTKRWYVKISSCVL